jgi:hypothetical protein
MEDTLGMSIKGIEVKKAPALQRDKKMEIERRALIQQALEEQGAGAEAEMLLHPMTSLEQVPASFLHDYQIYDIFCRDIFVPYRFFAGFSPRYRSLYILTLHPQHFVDMARADRVHITSPEQAVHYARTYLETTGPTASIFYLVNTLSEIRFPYRLEKEEDVAKQDFVEKYQTLITAPTVVQEEDVYIIGQYIVHEQQLKQYQIAVSPNGGAKESFVVLEEDLPLPRTLM